jgi:hypothetical protein
MLPIKRTKADRTAQGFLRYQPHRIKSLDSFRIKNFNATKTLS